MSTTTTTTTNIKQLSSFHGSIVTGADDNSQHILIKVIYPEQHEEQEQALLPVIIFLGGGNCPHESYSWLAVHIAKHGYCVILSSCVVPMGPKGLLFSVPLDFKMHQNLNEFKKGPATAGIKSIITHLQEKINNNKKSTLYNKLDMNQIILGGHSMGGALALGYGLYDDHQLTNIKAIFTYGASLVSSGIMPFFPRGTVQAGQLHTNFPPPNVLIMGGTNDGVLEIMSSSNDDDSTPQPNVFVRTFREGFQHHTNCNVDVIVIKGGNHMVICTPIDETCHTILNKDHTIPNDNDAKQIRQVIADTITKFLKSVIQDKTAVSNIQQYVPSSLLDHHESFRPTTELSSS